MTRAAKDFAIITSSKRVHKSLRTAVVLFAREPRFKTKTPKFKPFVIFYYSNCDVFPVEIINKRNHTATVLRHSIK